MPINYCTRNAILAKLASMPQILPPYVYHVRHSNRPGHDAAKQFTMRGALGLGRLAVSMADAAITIFLFDGPKAT